MCLWLWQHHAVYFQSYLLEEMMNRRRGREETRTIASRENEHRCRRSNDSSAIRIRVNWSQIAESICYNIFLRLNSRPSRAQPKPPSSTTCEYRNWAQVKYSSLCKYSDDRLVILSNVPFGQGNSDSIAIRSNRRAIESRTKEASHRREGRLEAHRRRRRYSKVI